MVEKDFASHQQEIMINQNNPARQLHIVGNDDLTFGAIYDRK